jgi:hypothetical protein
MYLGAAYAFIDMHRLLIKKKPFVLCGEEYSTHITDISRKIEDYMVCKREANL